MIKVHKAGKTWRIISRGIYDSFVLQLWDPDLGVWFDYVIVSATDRDEAMKMAESFVEDKE